MDKKLETVVSDVTVYPDRARVTRSARIELDPGTYQLEIADLPRVLDRSSVRASAKGTARARLLGVNVHDTHYVATPVEQVRELEMQIETRQDELNALQAQSTLLEKEHVTLQTLTEQTKTYAKGLAYGRIKADEQIALFDALRTRLETINTTLHSTILQQRTLGRELSKLKKDLKKLHNVRSNDRYTANVEVEITQAGDLSIELTYVVSQAQWIPLYDLRLIEDDPATDPTLEVGYLAEILQSTGENWDEIALTLSTARPALTETLPELSPWYIEPLQSEDMRRERPKLAKKQSMASRIMDKEEMDDGFILAELEAAPEPEMEDISATVVTARVESSGAAVTYKVPGTMNIPADGEPHKATVAQFSLIPQLDHTSAPKLVAAAYRRAKVSNDSPYTLLPGKTSLFVGDEFIGSTALGLTAPNGEIELYLGVDDRVKIKRELKRRDVDKKLLRDRRRLSYAYEIEVENLLGTETTLTIHDQLPTPRHENIKVKLENAMPAPQKKSDLGMLEWEQVIPAGQKYNLRFDFYVEYPRDMLITGLP